MKNDAFSEILSGSIWSLGATAISMGLSLLASIIIARAYGAEMMGIVAILNSVLILTTNLAALGSGNAILRLIPEHTVKYSLASAYLLYRKTRQMVLCISICAAVLFFFSANFLAGTVFGKPKLAPYFGIAAIFIVFNTQTLLNSNAARGIKRISFYAILQILPQSCNLILLLVLGPIFKQTDIPIHSLLLSTAFTGLTSGLILDFAFRKKALPNQRVEPISRKEILSISLPMFGITAMNLLMSQSLIFLLAVFRSEAEIGIFSVAVKFSILAAFALQAVNTMAAPKFSEFFHANQSNELFQVAKKSGKLVFWCATPILLTLILSGRPLLDFFFGREFLAAYPALIFLSIGQFVNAVSGSSGYFMNMTGHHKMFNFIISCSAGISICMGLLLIPGSGATGAGMTSMVSVSALNIAALIYIKNKFGYTTGYFPFLAKPPFNPFSPTK